MNSQLYLYQSNNLNHLGEKFAQLIAKSKQHLFQKDQIIIQTVGMKKWLTQQCASANGVFAGADFLQPAEYLMRLNFRLTGKSEERTVFERNALRWFIHRRLAEAPDRFPTLADYLGTSHETEEQKRFAFAMQVADLFDSYMLYRPELLEKWELGEYGEKRIGVAYDGQERMHEEWQMRLWQDIVEYHTTNAPVDEMGAPKGENPTKVLSNLHALLTDSNLSEDSENRVCLWAQKTEQIHLFSMSIVPPQYMEIFKAMAEHIDVHLYILNPSQYFWGDLLTERQESYRKKYAKNFSDAEFYYSEGNRLLRNLGESGRDFYQTLYSLPGDLQEVSGFDEGEPSSLLSQIQYDIRTWEDTEREVPLELTQDNSLTINRCYSKLREVEVLYDYLLGRFEQDPTLTTSDVLVLTPNLEDYAPLIAAHFGSADKNYYSTKRLSASISDQTIVAQSPLALLVKELLLTTTTLYDAPHLLGLFENYSAVSEQPLSSDDSAKLKKWIEESGIRWGIDDTFWQETSGTHFGDDRFSWQSGISRMLLGYALGESEGNPPAYAKIEGRDGVLLGRLLLFVDTLFTLQKRSLQNHTVPEWDHFFQKEILENLFPLNNISSSSDFSITPLIKIGASLSEQSVSAGSDMVNISYATFRTAYLSALENDRSEKGFLRGEITVSSMVPLRAIPFKVIAMIGMDYTAFPKVSQSLSFDLIAAAPRSGDRNGRKSDLYLFLETLISAQDAFYLSWQAWDAKGKEEIPPSSVVDQLCSFIEESYHMDGISPLKHIQQKMPLHPFSHQYQKEGTYQTYDSKWFAPAQNRVEKVASLFKTSFDAPLKEVVVTEQDLIQYFSDPLKDLFEKQLHMRLPKAAEDLSESEPFGTNGLIDYQLREAGVVGEIDKEVLYKALSEELYYSGDLPPGAALEVHEEKLQNEIQKFLARIPSSLKPKEFSWSDVVNDITVQCNFSVYQNGDELVLIEVGKLYAAKGIPNLKRYFRQKVLHLCVNMIAPTNVTLITLDTHVTLEQVSKEEAQVELETLLKYYANSRAKIIPYFGKHSFALARDEKTKIYPLFRKAVEEPGFNREADPYEKLFFHKSIASHFNEYVEYQAREIAEALFPPKQEEES